MPPGELQGLYQHQALTSLLAKRSRGIYLASLIFTPLQVSKMSGYAYRKTMGAADTPIDTHRAPGAESKTIWEDMPTTFPFQTRDHSLHSFLPDELRDVDFPLQEDIDKVETLADALNLSREVAAVQKITAAATSAGHTEAATEKFDVANPTVNPISYLRSKMKLIVAAVGRRPNTMILDYDVADAIYAHKLIEERNKYTLSAIDMNPTVDAMARYLATTLGIANVQISETGYRAAGTRGEEAPELVKIWGSSIWMGVVERPSLEYAGFGLQLRYNGVGATYGQTVRNGYLVEVSRVPSRKSDRFDVHDYHEDLVINPEAGYLVTDTLTSA